MNNSQLTLTQIFGAVMRQKVKGLLAFLLVVCLVMAIFVAWPKSYGSEGKLHVQLSRMETNLSATGSSNGPGGLSIQDTRETEIKSVEEVLKSRAVLEAVVRKIGAEEILENTFIGFLPRLTIPSFLKSNDGKAGDMSPAEYKKLKKIEFATNLLTDSLTVHNMKKTSVISVYVKSNSPRMAQTIVNEIINEARLVHQTMHGVSGSSAFFAEKIEEADEKLETAMTDLENFREERELLSVGAARFTLQEIIGSLEKNIVDTKVSIAQSQKQIDSLKKVIRSTPEKIVLETRGVERKSGDDATSAVFQLKNERARLLSQYRAGHPEVRKIDAQIKKMESRLNLMKDDRTEKKMEISQVHSSAKIQLVSSEIENVGSKARLKSLEERLKLAHKDAVKMNRAEIDADRLQRKINDTREDREMYVKKGREALASLSLDNSNLSTLVVAQQPSFVLKHASPRGTLFLPIALLLGGLSGLATAMFCERNHLSPSLNEVEVEQILEMPILVTLPRVYSSRNMVN